MAAVRGLPSEMGPLSACSELVSPRADEANSPRKASGAYFDFDALPDFFEDDVPVLSAVSPGAHRCSVRSRRRSSLAKSERLSRAIRKHFSMDDNDSESDFLSTGSQEEVFQSPSAAARYRLGHDSDSDGSCKADGDLQGCTLEKMFEFGNCDSCLDVEDLYSFDLEKVAAALQRDPNISGEELQDVIEEILAAKFEAEMTTSPAENLVDPSPLMAGDLAGRATPGMMTPPSDEEVAVVSGRIPELEPQGLAGRLVEVLASPTRQSRSSKVQSRRLSIAVDAALDKQKQSLPGAVLQAKEADDQTNIADKATSAAVRQFTQRRKSLLQAAEVVELAGFGEGDNPGNDSVKSDLDRDQKVAAQLEMVLKAVEGAHQRHRQSIAQAVRDVGMTRELEEQAVPQGKLSSRDRVRLSVAGFTARRASEKTVKKNTALMMTRASVAGRRVHCGPMNGFRRRGGAKMGTPGGA